ncbi:hypothetical protein [Gordonia malaquae]|uniref:hypothetical protein n=1 Tax=Gordonia malaquae TaxID=410332 RepID=UPI0030192DF3
MTSRNQDSFGTAMETLIAAHCPKLANPGDNRNVYISSEVMTPLADSARALEFGTFNNVREYGVTVTAGASTFCAYGYRAGDEQVHVEGCATAEMEPYGPYGGLSGTDVLANCGWSAQAVDIAAEVVAALVDAALASPTALTREQLVAVADAALATARSD